MGNLFISVEVDKDGILGKIASLEETAEKLWREARELKQMLSCEEKTADSSDESIYRHFI